MSYLIKYVRIKPSSPICNRETFDRLYKITEDEVTLKEFLPYLVGDYKCMSLILVLHMLKTIKVDSVLDTTISAV